MIFTVAFAVWAGSLAYAVMYGVTWPIAIVGVLSGIVTGWRIGDAINRRRARR